MNGSTAPRKPPKRTASVATARPGGPPTDTLPADPGPPWRTIAEIVNLPIYREGVSPVSSGFAVLDDALRGGFRPESLYILAGRTGSAKSSLVLNIARKVALAGDGVLVFKLEESPTEAVWRIHAATAQVELTRLLDGAQLADDERQRLADAEELIRTLPVCLSDRRNIRAIERLAQAFVGIRGRLVIIDQLSMVDCADAPLGYERATAVSGHLRLLARDLHVPILLVCQVNRPASKTTEHLSCYDLRDSGALENDAAAVMLIDRVRAADFRRQSADPLTLELLIDKNRYGRTTRDVQPLELRWWPQFCRIEDAAKPTAGDA